MEGEYDEGKLIFWSNGGPGASSMFGFMTEVGPFSLNADSLTTDEYLSTGIPTVFPNENSWSQLGDLLIFEAPSPVGFSYCGDDVSADGTSCGDWTDELAAENNLLALQAFYLKYPELKTKDLYLSGESYAGVYIPTMARSIITNDPSINLKGFAVGDACTGTEVLCGSDGDFGPWWDLTFMYGHGQLSTKTYDSIKSACGGEDTLKHPLANGGLSDACNAKLAEMDDEIGGYYEYALYDDCTYDNGLLKSAARPQHTLWRGNVEGALNDYTCGGGEVMEVSWGITEGKEEFVFKGKGRVRIQRERKSFVFKGKGRVRIQRESHSLTLLIASFFASTTHSCTRTSPK